MDDERRIDVDDRQAIERRIAEAKRSLSDHLAELGERLGEARRRFSLRDRVRSSPGLVLGGAAAIGLVLGLRRPVRVAVAPAPVRRRGLIDGLIHELVGSLLTAAVANAAGAIFQRPPDAGGPGTFHDHRRPGGRPYDPLS